MIIFWLKCRLLLDVNIKSLGHTFRRVTQFDVPPALLTIIYIIGSPSSRRSVDIHDVLKSNINFMRLDLGARMMQRKGIWITLEGSTLLENVIQGKQQQDSVQYLTRDSFSLITF